MADATTFAKKYLEDLLSFFGLNTEVQASQEDDIIQLAVPSSPFNGFLIGSRAETLYAFQQLTTAALRNKDEINCRVNIDVAGYKKQRAERLSQQAEAWMEEVISSGQQKRLSAMNAADRRIIHQLATDRGVLTESQGEGRDRHIVLRPKDSPDSK